MERRGRVYQVHPGNRGHPRGSERLSAAPPTGADVQQSGRPGDCRKRQGDDDVNQEVLAHALEIFESIRIFASFRPEKITTTTPLLRWGLTLMKGASLWDLIFTLAQ